MSCESIICVRANERKRSEFFGPQSDEKSQVCAPTTSGPALLAKPIDHFIAAHSFARSLVCCDFASARPAAGERRRRPSSERARERKN